MTTTANKKQVLQISEGKPTDQEIAQAIEKLTVARIALLISNPFFGNIATRLKLTEASDWLPTAATDGRNFYYNPKFVIMLKDKEVIFLVGHELLHVIYDHIGVFGRLDGRIPMLWNMAADYAVNRDLIDNRIGEKITTVDCLFDPKYKDMSAEQIYNDLFDNAEKINIDALSKKLLDQHLSGDSDKDDKTGKGNAPSLSEAEKEQIRNEVREAMLSAAEAVGIGNVPAGIRRMLTELTEPKMNWRELLQQQIESQIKNDFTYMKLSRRGWSCDAILPSMKKDPAVECTVAIDLSGSIGQKEMNLFISELVGICQQYESFKIGVMTWDTAVYGYEEFTEDNFEDLKNYQMKGGGGTDPECVYRYLEENDIQPKQLVMFTDGEFHTHDDHEMCDTLWLIKNDYRKDIEISFGTTVYFEE